MPDNPSKYSYDLEALKEQLREEFQTLLENYVADSFDAFLSGDTSEDDEEDAADDPDDPTDTDPDPDPEDEQDDPSKSKQLSLLFKNNNGRYVSAENTDGSLREFGFVSQPDGQGSISVTVFAKIDGKLSEKPAYYRVNYNLID